MPGRHEWGKQKERIVQLRVATPDLARWKKHVDERGGYLSVLIRRAVDEYLARNPKPEKAPQLDEWHERRRWWPY